MSDTAVPAGKVSVRLWAGARAAAGVGSVDVPVDEAVTLTRLRDEVVRRAAGGGADPARLERVLAVCSVLVGDRPLGGADPAAFLVAPGSRVEFLPPFAGG